MHRQRQIGHYGYPGPLPPTPYSNSPAMASRHLSTRMGQVLPLRSSTFPQPGNDPRLDMDLYNSQPRPHSTARTSPLYSRHPHSPIGPSRLFLLWTHGSVKKPASSNDDTILRDKKIKAAQKPHSLTSDQAVKLVYENLVKLAASGAVKAEGYPAREIAGEDLAFAIFHEIDRLVFGEVLRGNVHLVVGDPVELGEDMDGATRAPGKDNARVQVLLNRAMFSRAALGSSSTLHRAGYLGDEYQGAHVVKVLLHQMVHAFLLQCCGTKDLGTEGQGHDLSHTLQFCMLMNLLDKALIRESRQLPALIGQRGRLVVAWSQHRSSSHRHVNGHGMRRLGQSLCDGRDVGCEERECQHNIHQAVELENPKIDLEARCPRDKDDVPRPLSQYIHLYKGGTYTPHLRQVYASVHSSYIEVVFKDRAVAYEKVTIQHNGTLASMKNGAQLEITTPDNDTFTLFDRYLNTRDYLPGSSDSKGSDKSSEDNSLLADIRMFRLSVLISNAELRELTLGHLRHHIQSVRNIWLTQRSKPTNLIPALQFAYHGPCIAEPSKTEQAALDKEPKDPPHALRGWMKSFLSQPLGPEPSSFEYPRARPTVLSWLEEGELRHQWTDLKEKGGSLITDIDSVRRTLQAWDDSEENMAGARVQDRDLTSVALRRALDTRKESVRQKMQQLADFKRINDIMAGGHGITQQGTPTASLRLGSASTDPIAWNQRQDEFVARYF